jgi:hypothetical protein
MGFGYLASLDEIKRIARTTSFRPERANAKLSDTDLGIIASNIARAKIDPALRALGVVLPLDQGLSPSGWALLAELNALGAACRVDQINFTENAPNKGAEKPWQCVEFDAALKALQAGQLDLIDIGAGPVSDDQLGGFFYATTEDGGLVDSGGAFRNMDDEF